MKILVAYDGSAHADRAIRDLGRAGLPPLGEARVLTIADVLLGPTLTGRFVDGEPLEAMRSVPAQSMEAVQTAMDIARKGAKRTSAVLPQWDVTAIAQADSPAWGIIKECDTWRPDLVVVGSQGRGAVGRRIMGSVSHKVLTEARCNVRVARGRKASVGDPPRFIVGVDGSAGALAAVSAAAARRWPPGTRGLVVSALEPRMVVAPVVTAFLGDAFGRLDSSDRLAWMQATVEKAAALIREGNPETSVGTFLRDGDPKRVLLEQARELRADAIFVGARGLVGADRMLLGSVSTAIAMRADCSVEVVHDGGHKKR